MTKISPSVIRALVIGLVVVIVGGGAWYLLSGNSSKKLTAQFDSAVGVYPGTPVKIMGINVGAVTSVNPKGTYVSVTMDYDSKYKLKPTAVAYIIANSLVSDRYIQLAPILAGNGPSLPNNATIKLQNTASPAELDDIYAELSKLSTALGPKGANKNGALSDFINVSAANLQGNGAALGSSITNLSEAAKTLSDGSGDLFGTVKNLQAFTQALSDSDLQIRHVETQLAQVAHDLASERADLGLALHNLAGALDQVASFVQTNAAKTHSDLHGLASIAQILVKEQASLNETLAVGPVALANLVHAYQPDLGVIPARSNLASLTDPASLCDVLDFGHAFGNGLLGQVGLVIGNLLGPLTGDIANACIALFKKTPGGAKAPPGLTPAQLTQLVNDLLSGLGGGLGGLLPGS
jgi:phospholipid/cholesterol/gamma-HCH transport system substrate-binding protein